MRGGMLWSVFMREIQVEDLKQRLGNRDALTLIDVRTPAEYASGHVPEAVNIPLDRITTAKVQSVAHGKEVVLLCMSGKRSERACEIVADEIPDAYSLVGGTNAWIAAGNAVQGSGKTVMSLERQVRIVAGTLVLFGLLLGMSGLRIGYGLSAFVGAGLIFAGVTDTCGMAMLLAKMPWNTASCAGKSCAR